MDDVNDYLLGSSAPTAKFDVVGKVVRGTVVKAEVQNDTDFKTRKPKTYDDGSPIKMVVVTLKTDERDESIEDDDGLRRVFVRGANMMRALRAGMKRNPLIPGGTLAIKYTGDGEPPAAGLSAPKEYAVRYEPPVTEEDALPF